MACRWPAATAPRLAVFLIAMLLPAVRASAREVVSVRELHSALADPSVLDIAVLPGGGFNFSLEDWPSQVLVQRNVTVTGVDDAEGRPPYVDVNRLTELVVVGAGGSLYQRNLYVDDCLIPVMPLLCFAVGSDNGNLTMQDLVLGDTSCTEISQSTATDWLLKSAYWATWQTRWATVDDRSIHVVDTGEIAGMPHGVRWRIINSTFRCTGNETHPLPGGYTASGVDRETRDMQVAAATVATLLAVMTAGYYLMNRNVVNVSKNESPEAAVARSKGIVLQALIGQGTFGRVYRGQFRGATVAIKVIEFPLFERRVAAEVTKECQHAMGCHHECVAECITFFTVTVRSHPRRVQVMGRVLREGYAHDQYIQEAGQPEAAGGLEGVQQYSGAAPLLPHQQQQHALHGEGQPSTSAAGAARARAAAAAAEPAGPLGAAAAGGAADAMDSMCSNPSSAGDTLEGVMTLLVMEYCSLGNLHSAISAGRFFLDRRSQRLNLEWVCRTALDVARGLEHLHDARHLVHRDVSTNNVLLLPDPADPRGFRAKLSDFGLATVLRDRQTHKTSQLKGTVDFMPPEIFTCGEIRFAVDIYGFGICLYWMCKGDSPFTGMAPFQVVGKKLEEVHRKQHIMLPPNMPASLCQLVWDCTHWDPHARPSASDLVVRLQEIVARVSQEEAEGAHPLPKKAASA